MQWLIPSIIATLVGTLLLAGVYFYLYHTYLLVWFWAWALYSSRFAFELIGVTSPSVAVTVATHSVTLLSGILLLWGTFCFAGRPFSRIWILVCVFGIAWIAITTILDVAFLLITVPSFTLLAGFYIWTGLVIIRSGISGRTSRLITGLCFILWGIHKADFPVLRMLEWFAPWGFLLVAIFEITAAIGTLLIFFESQQTQLASKERAQRGILTAARNISFNIIDTSIPEPLVLEFSPGAEQIFGYTREEMLGQRASILHIPEGVTQFPEEHRKMREGKTGFTGEAILVRKSGEIFPAMFNTHPLFDEKGTMYAAVGVSIDITKRKQDEEKLRLLVDEKNILLAEVHHRVKNNMQIIISLMGLQAREIGDERLSIAFEESRNRITSMALVHELLYRSIEFARIDFGDYVDQLVSTMFNVHMVDPERIHVQVVAKQAFMELEKAIPYGLILNELITNSSKYAFPGGRNGKLWVYLKHQKDKMVLRVGDNGLGISQTIDLDTTNSLGLQLVKLLSTHDLGGSVKLLRNKFTQFQIEFPLLSLKEV